MTLALKLLLTPLLISAASLVGRRWGAAVGGWMVGLPLTSAPVAVILTAEHGTQFAADAAVGIIGGVASQGVFAVLYARMARRAGAGRCLLGGAIAFAASTAILNAAGASLQAMLVVTVAVLSIGLRVVPEPEEPPPAARLRAPRWDLPARIALATGFVAIVTGVAGLAGPRLAGLITPFPIYASVLTVFAHRQLGADAAAATLRGLLAGLYGFALFFAVLNLALPHLGWWAFGVAGVVTALLQAWSYRSVRPAAMPATVPNA